MEGGKYEIPDIPDIPGLDDENMSPGGGGGGGGGGRAGGGSGSRSGGSGRAGPRRWLWLLVGIVVGVVGTLFLPSLVAPYLPAALQPDHQEVRGLVLEKSREADRLLLTVESERGAMLATFAEQVAELDLLVAQGDSVTLSLGAYRPFVDDPSVIGVRKNPGSAAESATDPDSVAPSQGAAQGRADGEGGEASSGVDAGPFDTATAGGSGGEATGGIDLGLLGNTWRGSGLDARTTNGGSSDRARRIRRAAGGGDGPRRHPY